MHTYDRVLIFLTLFRYFKADNAGLMGWAFDGITRTGVVYSSLNPPGAVLVVIKEIFRV